MAIDSYSMMNVHAGQLASIGNRQAFAAQIGGMGGMSTFSAPPQGPSPFMQNLLGVASMGMQTGGALPGSTQQQLQSQQMGMGILGMAISEQTPILGGMFQNMQGQAALNQQMQQNFTFARPGGFGFNYQQMQGINQSVGQTAQQNPMWTQQQMRNVAGMGMQMGMFRGTQDVNDFQQKFRQLIRSAEQITRTLGGTLEEGVQAISRMRGMGVFRQADQMRMMQTLPGMAAASGTSVGQLQQFGGQVAQMLRPMGVQAPAGAQAGMQALATLGTGQQMGVINEQQVWQATGMGGVAGQQALGARMMQIGARFTKKTGGKIMMAAFVDPNTKEFDDESWQKFQSGQMSFNEVQSKAHANIRDMGGYLGWQQNEGRIRGEFMSGTQGMGGLFTMRKAFEGHWGDPRKAQMILRRQMHMSREEAEVFAPIMQQLPQIMREQEYAGKIAEQQAERQEQWKAHSPQARMQAGMRAIKQKYLAGTERLMNRFVDKITDTVTKGLEDYTGNIESELSRDFLGSIEQMSRTTQGAQALQERASVYGRILEKAGTGGGGDRGRPTGATDVWSRFKRWSKGVPDWVSETIGEGYLGVQKMVMGAGASKVTPQELSKWGLGGNVQTTGSAREAYDIARRLGKDAMVLKGQEGFAVLRSPGPKQKSRALGLTGGELKLKDVNMTEGDFNRIMTGTLPQEVREAIQANDFEKAEDLVMKRASQLGTPIEGHQARFLAQHSAQKQGVETNPYVLMSGSDMTWGQRAGQAIGKLTNYDASREEINTYLQDPDYQDLFLLAAQGDKGAIATARQKARDEGKSGMADWLGRIEGDWGQALGAFKEAAGSLNMEAMEKQAKARQDMGQKYTEGFKKRWEKPGKTEATRLNQLLASIAGGEKMQALSRGEAAGVGAGEEMEEIVRQYGRQWSAKQMKQTAKMARAQGYVEAAETLEKQAGYTRKEKGKRGKLIRQAGMGLADILGIEDPKKRAQLFNRAQKKGFELPEGPGMYETPEQEEQARLYAEAMQKGPEGKEARMEMMEKEDEDAANKARASAGNPQTVKLASETIKELARELNNVMNAPPPPPPGGADPAEGAADPQKGGGGKP